MKYLMTFTSDKSLKVVFDYSDGLVSIVFEGCFLDLQKKYILSLTPPALGDTHLEDYFNSPKIRIMPMQQDLSFANFWNTYSHKHGSKPRAEKIWNALNDADKALALVKIKKYLFDLANSNIEQAHASTWLGQRRWEN